MKLAPALALAAASILLTACSRPSRQELAGMWVDPGNQATLRLNDNGSAQLINWSLSKIAGMDDERRATARGHWTYGNDDGQDTWTGSLWPLDLDIDVVDGPVKADLSKRNDFEYGWCGWDRCILAVRGDPDSGDELVFFKSSDGK